MYDDNQIAKSAAERSYRGEGAIGGAIGAGYSAGDLNSGSLNAARPATELEQLAMKLEELCMTLATVVKRQQISVGKLYGEGNQLTNGEKSTELPCAAGAIGTLHHKANIAQRLAEVIRDNHTRLESVV